MRKLLWFLLELVDNNWGYRFAPKKELEYVSWENITNIKKAFDTINRNFKKLNK